MTQFVWPKEAFTKKRRHPNLTNKMYPYLNDPFLSDSERRLLLLIELPDKTRRHFLVISRFKDAILIWNVEEKKFEDRDIVKL